MTFISSFRRDRTHILVDAGVDMHAGDRLGKMNISGEFILDLLVKMWQ